MKKITGLLCLVAAVSLVPLSAANAQRYPHHYGGRGWHHGGGPGWHGGYHHHDHYGGDVAAGIMGLAAGAIIAGAIADSQRPREYYGTIPPRTDAWYRWCASSYRSFNPRTGTYRGYDGRDHFCVAR